MKVDRVGVFLVPAEHVAATQQQEAAVDALEFPEHGGEYPTRAWRIARHAQFERLLEISIAHRVLPGDALGAVAELVASMTTRDPRAFRDASPAARRALVAQHLTRVTDTRLRAALGDVLARAADPGAGLWILYDPAPAPEPTAGAESDDLEPAPAGGGLGLEAYVADADRRWMSGEPTESSYHAFLCELSDDDARFAAEAWRGIDDEDLAALARAADQAAGRCRRAAIAHTEEANRDAVEALERSCSRAPVPSLARTIYSAAQAAALLAWLERQRESVARDRVLPPLRRAVEHGHAFAIVFHHA